MIFSSYLFIHFGVLIAPHSSATIKHISSHHLLLLISIDEATALASGGNKIAVESRKLANVFGNLGKEQVEWTAKCLGEAITGWCCD
jgi:hypothetical protein